ncbi:hypothetical protein VitviT2T_018718 [Vitis vinifera]|uniref:MORF/ORRM1/DAG-like MORF domain-containing protein n=1 Tax=Vitis vinifera TaxID=29760 RepID=A0ABY9D0C0_VITVI|nr:multiple organellar RNA editing factor 1, mitochondrial isoform X2 [Vitis vinifera]WKA00358.1 hypothetical protein VitviT2T_018718 [Vitis vinifera]|eukprot:XP_002269948.1 PREDICTED: multiple organellar RNA editing factor 1, mitochondrial [Vitis vinifera]
MALYSLRLRQALKTLTPLLGHRTPLPQVCALPAVESCGVIRLLPATNLQSRPFRSSPIWLSSSRSFNNQNEEIGPDTILFEGCDYNHWLITMDFPKDPKPTPEEMVETYVQTLAKGLNISVEEAKLKMYACSTTTYTGFQAVMTEEESEKFRGLPGVVFILPDSYINPATKEYGGDKYINGTIIPRPPPVQYGRTGGRYGDRNRNTERPRYDRQGGPMPNRQGNPPYDNRGSMQGDGGNYGAPQNYPPQQNYGPAGQGPMPMSNRDYAHGGRDTYQGERRDTMPPYQGNYNQGQQGNYHPQERRDFSQGAQRNYAPPDQRDVRGDNRNYNPQHSGNYGQGTGGSYGQGMGSGPSGYGQAQQGHGEGQRFSQVDQRNDMQDEQRNYPPTGNTNQGRY